MKRNFIHVLTVFLLIFTLLTPGLALPDQSSAATPTDIKGHWANTYIARGIQLGFITGYPDGTFLPDNPVSRAEFAKMMNSALGNTGTASSNFKDVPTFEWFYNDVNKAVGATYVDGYGDGTFLPNKAISRQEAAVMIARIVPSYGVSSNLNTYKDGSKTADWATEYMKKIVGKGYLGAYDDGLLHPDDNLTRAQTAKIICAILDKEDIVKTFTTIKNDNTVVKNTLYTNAVTISKDLGEGDATFQNCTLLGGLLVNGGGKSTITLENCRATQLNVNKSGSTVRVLAKGATTIPQTIAQEVCSLETVSLAGGIFGKGFDSLDIRKNADTSLTGYFPLVNMVGTNGTARLEGCSITNLVVTKDAKSSNIYIDSRSALASTDVNAIAAFHGPGTIKHMNANVSGITYETKPTKWTLASGVVAPKETNPDLKAVFLPDNGAKSIALTVKPTLSFSAEIETFKGDAITAAYLKDNLVFKKSSATGANVAFTAALSTNKKIITVTPTANLDSNQAYYLGFAKDKFRTIGTKESLTAKSVIFTTINITPTASISPANGAINVGVKDSLKITFSEPVFKKDGKAIDSGYLADNITVLRNAAGSNLNTSASISGNVVTIPSPSGDWGDGASYTITVNGSSFKNATGNYVAQTVSSFIAGTKAPEMNISSTTASSSNVTITADSTINGRGYFVVIEGAPGSVTQPSIAQIKAGQDSRGASASSSNGTIGASDSSFLVTGLNSNTEYTVFAVTNGNGKDSAIASKNFNTPFPDAKLNSLECAYTASGGGIVNRTISISSSMIVNVTEGATSINIMATAPSDVTITFSSGVSGVGLSPLTSSNIDMSHLEVGKTIPVIITTSGISFIEKTYTLTLTKVAGS